MACRVFLIGFTDQFTCIVRKLIVEWFCFDVISKQKPQRRQPLGLKWNKRAIFTGLIGSLLVYFRWKVAKLYQISVTKVNKKFNKAPLIWGQKWQQPFAHVVEIAVMWFFAGLSNTLNQVMWLKRKNVHSLFRNVVVNLNFSRPLLQAVFFYLKFAKNF